MFTTPGMKLMGLNGPWKWSETMGRRLRSGQSAVQIRRVEKLGSGHVANDCAQGPSPPSPHLSH